MIESARRKLRPLASTAFELTAILLWAAWVGRAYLDLRWQIWPAGPEFPEAAQAYYNWLNWRVCGGCVMWNGALNGGAPTFVDLHSAVLHPLVVVTTLLWGVVNGAKLTAVLTLAMGGVAQWWLGRAMGLGRAGRLWGAFVAVAAGHVAGRGDGGQMTLAISAAAACLVYAPAYELLRTGRRRAAVALAATTALAFLAGHAYIQIGLFLVVLPAIAVAMLVGPPAGSPATRPWLKRELAWAAGLTVLLASALAVPVAHFYPSFGKYLDPNYATPQKLWHVPLNLVIVDPRPWLGNAVYPLQVPYLYVNYIGWLPVVFAAAGAVLLRRERRALLFLGASIVLGLAAAAGLPLRILGLLAPEFATGVRHPSVIASLVVPPILGLAALAVDRTLAWLRGVDARLTAVEGEPGRLRREALPMAGTSAVIVALLWAIVQVQLASRTWIKVTDTGVWDFDGLIAALRTNDAQWAQTPWGELAPGMFAFEAGLKIAQFRRPWWIDAHNFPMPLRESFRNRDVDPTLPQVATDNPDFKVVVHAENEYAVVVTEDGGRHACRATARGGDIDVVCAHPVAGRLVLQENRWSGWRVRRDGRPVALQPDAQWLATEAPAGEHRYAFRYRPWDVPLGLAMTVLGLVLATWQWFAAPRPHPTSPMPEVPPAVTMHVRRFRRRGGSAAQGRWKRPSA